MGGKGRYLAAGFFSMVIGMVRYMAIATMVRWVLPLGAAGGPYRHAKLTPKGG
jgi:hypothetical protein